MLAIQRIFMAISMHNIKLFHCTTLNYSILTLEADKHFKLATACVWATENVLLL